MEGVLWKGRLGSTVSSLAVRFEVVGSSQEISKCGSLNGYDIYVLIIIVCFTDSFNLWLLCLMQFSFMTFYSENVIAMGLILIMLVANFLLALE